MLTLVGTTALLMAPSLGKISVFPMNEKLKVSLYMIYSCEKKREKLRRHYKSSQIFEKIINQSKMP